MKKVFFALLAVCIVAPLTFAQAMPPISTSEMVTVQGTLVDNLCVQAHKPEELADYVSTTYDKTCAILPDCAASGYSILSDGKLYKFDAESDAKIVGFLQKKESTIKVVVTVKKSGDMLTDLVGIENQK